MQKISKLRATMYQPLERSKKIAPFGGLWSYNKLLGHMVRKRLIVSFQNSLICFVSHIMAAMLCVSHEQCYQIGRIQRLPTHRLSIRKLFFCATKGRTTILEAFRASQGSLLITIHGSLNHRGSI